MQFFRPVPAERHHVGVWILRNVKDDEHLAGSPVARPAVLHLTLICDRKLFFVMRLECLIEILQ
jgi:hypothetical protein